FKSSKYATGEYFDKYTKCESDLYTAKLPKIIELFKKHNVTLPTQSDWSELVESIKKYGLANSHVLAVAPTGSISYLSSCTPSLQPVVSPVEVR
ncbi:ribonucleotide-diphosphate reductase subunit alpha, partial [Mycoplasmopsis synoviae]